LDYENSSRKIADMVTSAGEALPVVWLGGLLAATILFQMAALIGVSRLQKKLKRSWDTTDEPITVQTEPPAGIDLITAGQLRISERWLAAWLIDLAMRGKVHLIDPKVHPGEWPRCGVQLVETTGLLPGEAELLAAPFPGLNCGETIWLYEQANQTISGMADAGALRAAGVRTADEITEAVRKRAWKIAAKRTQVAQAAAEQRAIAHGLIHKVRWMAYPLIAAFFLGLAVVVVSMNKLPRDDGLLFWLTLILANATFLVGGSALLFFDSDNSLLTPAGRRVRNHLLGLKLFLDLLDEQRTLQASGDASVYERLLPYAVLIGHEQRLLTGGDQPLLTALAAHYQTHPPAWFSSQAKTEGADKLMNRLRKTITTLVMATIPFDHGGGGGS
jgi:hypothetical protein